VPEDVPLAVEALLSEDSVPDARRTFEALYVNARRATYDAIVMLICRSGDRGAHAADELSRRGDLPVVTIVDGYDGELGPGGHRSLDGWKNASQPWTARVNTDLISAER
jgi:rhodanese-related sulfurtransferase